MAKVVIAGILGGIVVFAWGVLSHTVLPLGQVGISQLPEEDAVVAAMRRSIDEPGLYFFPGMDMSESPTEAEQAAWVEKYQAGPTGVLVYNPTGEQPMGAMKLLMQLACDLVSALLAAALLAQVRSGFWTRVSFVTLLGLFAWARISFPYWNWYRFPADFTTAAAIHEAIAWLLAGLVLAAIVKPART